MPNQDSTNDLPDPQCCWKVRKNWTLPGELDRVEATHICPEKALAQLLLRGHSFEMQVQTK
jgi:hypothetical protein